MSLTCSVLTFLDLWGIVLVHATWQLATIACLLALFSQGTRSPQTFGRWCLIALFLCPTLMILTLVFLTQNWLPMSPAVLGTDFLGITVAGWLTRFWLIGISVAAIVWIAAWLRVIRLCRLPQLPVPASWQLTSVHHALQVRVIDTHLVPGPVTVGWQRPIILVPQHCIATLTAEQAKLLLEHELAHIGRKDFFWNVLQSFVELLLFFHPTIWCLSRWIRSEREFACDDAVLSLGGNRVLYARTLAQLAEHDRRLQSSLVAADGSPLRTRVERILRNKTSSRIHRWQLSLCWLTLLGGLLCGLPGMIESQTAANDATLGPVNNVSGVQVWSMHCCPS